MTKWFRFWLAIALIFFIWSFSFSSRMVLSGWAKPPIYGGPAAAAFLSLLFIVSILFLFFGRKVGLYLFTIFSLCEVALFAAMIIGIDPFVIPPDSMGVGGFMVKFLARVFLVFDLPLLVYFWFKIDVLQ